MHDIFSNHDFWAGFTVGVLYMYILPWLAEIGHGLAARFSAWVKLGDFPDLHVSARANLIEPSERPAQKSKEGA
jgi:hypothetical protein